ncbi:MAG: MFS transporter [Kocuria sp.]|nr:MFS transporter [Kocuria sp.]
MPATAATSSAGHFRKTPRKAALAAWVGSALEYYDFAVYGTAAALVINHLFFPPDSSPGVAILLSMSTVGIAYVVRPLGALIMGPLGDRYGRRFVMMLTLFMMGGATFVVGCLPTYDHIGLLAPALLVVCRIVQGLSASGEQASAISVSLEHSTENHRALTTSWTLQGTQFGTLLATAVFIPFTVILPEEQLFSWGWRIPFWLSALVVLTAYIIRRTLEEPPQFRQSVAHTHRSTPLGHLFRHHKAAVLRVACAAMINTVLIVFQVWALSYGTSVVGLDKPTMLWVAVVANGVALGAIPLAAAVADRVGRRPVFITGTVGSAIMTYPYLAAVTSGNWAMIFLLGAILAGFFYSMANGIWPSFYAEMFPTRVRVTGLALGTQIGFAVSGGFAPPLASFVAGQDGSNWVAAAIMVSCACVISGIAAFTATETKNRTLEEIDVLHTSRTEAVAARP